MIKKATGVLTALCISLVTLYSLFFGYNYYKKMQFTAPVPQDGQVHHKILQYGDVEIFPKYQELGDLPPFTVIRNYAAKGEQTVFDVTYNLDRFALRNEGEFKGPFGKHLLVGGCSIAFGSTLPNENSVTGKLRNKTKDYRVVNLGNPGGGLHTQIRTFDLIPVKEIAPEENGTYIYLFFDDHVQRFLAGPAYSAWAVKQKVHYDVKNGKLIRMTLQESSAYQNYNKTKASGLEHVYVKAHGLLKWSTEDIQNFMTGIYELKKQYLTLYPKGRFIFAILPISNHPENMKLLYKEIKKASFEVFEMEDEYQDFMRTNKVGPEYFKVPIDGHPNEKFTNLLSDLLLKKMKL